jgi:hypothetical protein
MISSCLYACACWQSILTGESHSVDKTVRVVLDPKAVYQDKINILFSVRAAGHTKARQTLQHVSVRHSKAPHDSS